MESAEAGNGEEGLDLRDFHVFNLEIVGDGRRARPSIAFEWQGRPSTHNFHFTCWMGEGAVARQICQTVQI